MRGILRAWLIAAAFAPLGACGVSTGLGAAALGVFAAEHGGFASGRAVAVFETPIQQTRAAGVHSLDRLAVWPRGDWVGDLATALGPEITLAPPTAVERYFQTTGLSSELADLPSAERDRRYAALARAVDADAVLAVFVRPGPSDEPFRFGDGRVASAHGAMEVYDAVLGALAWDERLEVHSLNRLTLVESDVERALAGAAAGVLARFDVGSANAVAPLRGEEGGLAPPPEPAAGGVTVQPLD